MKDTENVKTPECEKLSAITPKSQSIGEFLEWLLEVKGYVLAEYIEDDLYQVRTSNEKLLAEYFDIDLQKVSREREALLEAIRQ